MLEKVYPFIGVWINQFLFNKSVKGEATDGRETN